MAVREDRVNLVITITGDSARKELGLLDQKAIELRQQMKGLKKDSDDYVAAAKELKDVEKRQEELRKQIGLTGLSMRQLRSEANRLRTLRDNITPGTEAWKEHDRQLRAVQARMKELNPQVQQTGGLFEKMKAGAIAQLGGIAAAFVTLQAAVRGVKSIITTFTEFQQQMAEVKAISGATAEEFKMLEADAKRLGSTTQFTASQVGELQKEYAKLGFSTPEILAATEATLDLATATGEDLARSAEVVGATIRGFNLDARETQRVTDVMAETFNRTGSGLEDYAEAMKLVAPVAAVANISIETTSALIGKLADSGIKGSLAGTALKNVISKLADANSPLAQELGFTVKNADDLNKAFKLLAERNIDLTEATELTDERAKAAFITLIRGADATELLADQLGNAGGAAAEMAEVMRSTVQGRFLELKSAAEGLAIAVGEKLEPVFRFALTAAIGFINGLRGMGSFLLENKETIIALGLALLTMNGHAILAAATTLKLAAVQKINTIATTTAAIAQRAWNAATAAWPGLLIVAAVYAVVKAIDIYRKNTAEAIQLEKDRVALTQKLSAVQEELSEVQKKTTDQVNKLNELSPEQLQNLRDEIALQIQLTRAKLEKLKADALDIAQRERDPSIWQTLGNAVLSFGNQYAFAAKQGETAAKNYVEAQGEFADGIKSVEESLVGWENQQLAVVDALTKGEQAIALQPQTINQYEKKLGDLKTALNGLILGSEAYIRVQNEIKKTQEEFDRVKGKDLSGDQKKALDDLRKYQEQLRNIQIDAIADEEQREIAALEEKYNRQIAALEREKTLTQEQAIAKAALVKALEEQQQKEVADLKDKYAEERRDAEFDRDSQNLKEWGAVQKLLIQEQVNDGIITEEQGAQKRAELERQLLQEKSQLARQYGQDTVAIEQGIADAIAEQNKNELQRTQDTLVAKAQLRVLKAKEGTQEEFEARMELIATQMAVELENFTGTEEQKAVIRQEWLNKIEEMEQAALERSVDKFKLAFDQIMQGISALATISANANTKELQDDKRRNDAKKKELKRQLDAKLITEEQYKAEVAKLDEQYDAKARKLKREQFVKEKQASIIQSIINTAVAATSALKTPWLVPLIIAAGLAQTAAIASQPIPEFREGLHPMEEKQRALVNRVSSPGTGKQRALVNRVSGPTTGIVKGPAHEQEGIKLLDSQTGQVIGEMEGDEGIFSKKMYVNNKSIIDAIFAAKGAPVDIPALSIPAPVIDTSRVIENIRIERFENGRLPVGATAGQQFDLTPFLGMMQDMKESNEQLRSTLTDIKDNGLEGVWDFDRFRRGKELREKIENDSSLS